MDRGEDVLRVVEGPVVDRADPFDPESRTAELAQHGAPRLLPPPDPDDPIVPPPGSGPRGWGLRVLRVFRRGGRGLLVVAVPAALPLHFFTGQVDDTVVAAPALSDLLGGFGLLLLPLMVLAYFAVAALPLVLSLAGTVGVAVPAAADGRVPGVRAVWGLVAYRLRPLWLWFAGFAVVTQALPLFLTAEALGFGVAAPLTVVLGLVSTAVLTLTGLLGCVVLIERGHGLRRALHLLSLAPTAGLVLAALAHTALPRLAEQLAGPFAATAVGLATAVLWAVAALVTYAAARRAEGPVTSRSLRSELAAPELF